MSVPRAGNRDDSRHEHCTYCGAIWDERSVVRFWYIDEDLFCEDCAADYGDALLKRLELGIHGDAS